MITKGDNKYSISFKSLLVIVALQLIALQLQAAIFFNLNQEPCDHTLNLMFLAYDSKIQLENFHSFYYIKKNKSLLAVSLLPKLRPPR